MARRLALDVGRPPSHRPRARLLQGHLPGRRGRRGARARARGGGVDGRSLPGRRRRRGHDGGAAAAALGGETAAGDAHDPLGRPVDAGFALLEDGGTAVVESRRGERASALIAEERPRPAERRQHRRDGRAWPRRSPRRGAPVVLVGAGGSATTDGGAGAMAAIERAGGLRGARLVVLCDVRTPFERAAGGVRPAEGRR